MPTEYISHEDENNFIEEKPKNKYGQYFTPKIVADFMIDLADINIKSKILEPSAGEGIFISLLQEKAYNDLVGYEIDKELCNQFSFVKNESFVTAKIKDKFDLIIGNPPYIRWKNLEADLKKELISNRLWNKYFNSLCDYLYIFILKSIELLEENGQLIFICPEYWMNTTHSISLRNYMVDNGYFESIYHFNETPIFKNVNVSIVIFKYIKSKNKDKSINIVKYYKNKALTVQILNSLKDRNCQAPDIKRFSVPQFLKNKRWLLTNAEEVEEIKKFEHSCSIEISSKQDLFTKETLYAYPTIGDICDIGNGMVSGLDKAFQLNDQILNENEKAKTIKVLKAKNLMAFHYKDITPYIFANDIKEESLFKTDFPTFYKKLSPLKEKLEKRYQYNRKINFWEWVFLRNYTLFKKDCPRIFVPCKERISNKDYFRFSFVPAGIFPTQDVTAIFLKENTKESIYYVLSFLNNYRVFNWLKNKGIIKGNIVEFSEKPLSSIPFRKINWNDHNEVTIHNEITNLTLRYLETKDSLFLEKINTIFNVILD